jgi:hypothetical protein
VVFKQQLRLGPHIFKDGLEILVLLRTGIFDFFADDSAALKLLFKI